MTVEPIDPLGLIFLLSITLPFVWAGLLVLGSLGATIWDWIDEVEDTLNPVATFQGWVRGFKRISHNPSRFYRAGDSEPSFSAEIWFASAFVIFFSTWVVGLSIIHPWLAFSITTFVLLAFLTRFARRCSKLLNKHINDKQAHK